MVTSAPQENERLKRLTRRRRQLVEEKVLILGRLYADLHAAAPVLADITTVKDARWFLHFLTSRPRLRELADLEEKDILALPAIGKVFAKRIQRWQHNASFSSDEALVPWCLQVILFEQKTNNQSHQASEQYSSTFLQSACTMYIHSYPMPFTFSRSNTGCLLWTQLSKDEGIYWPGP